MSSFHEVRQTMAHIESLETPVFRFSNLENNLQSTNLTTPHSIKTMAPAVISYNDLSSFDLVYAIPQETINKQFQLLNALDTLPLEWKESYHQNTVNATFGTPEVDLNTGDAMSNKAKLTLPIVEGSMTMNSIEYDKDGNPVIVPKDIVINGSSLILTTNVSIADVASSYKDVTKIPKEVKQQLENFSSDMFSIEHLFLNFENVNLLTDYQLETNGKIDTSEPNTILTINALLKSFIDKLKNTAQPYIVGYSVTDKKPEPSDTTWVPTGVTYNIYSDPVYANRSSINYLLMTDGKPVPTGNVGLFDHNWIESDNIQGTFAISQRLVMGHILTQVAKKLGISVQKFTNPTSTTFSATKRNSEGGKTTCVVGTTTNSNTITINLNNTFRKDVHDKLGINIGYVDGWVNWTTTLTFNLDSKTGKLTITAANSEPASSATNHPNFIGSIEKVFADIADGIISFLTFDQVNNVFNKMVQEDWSVNVGTPLTADFAVMKSRIVLPAGNQLLFKDINFYTDGAMLLSTTIKN